MSFFDNLFHKNQFISNDESRILLLSMREIHDLAAYCLLYEIEDVTYNMDKVDIIGLANSYDLYFFRKVYYLINSVTRSTILAKSLTPQLSPFSVEKEYELFFPIFNFFSELFLLQSIKGWRNKCQKAACYISEVWEHQIYKRKSLLEFLKDFDHIFLGVRNSTEVITKLTGKPCTYVPPAVDVLKFAPHSLSSHRGIDVCGIGRRSNITHKALLELAEKRKMFYYYDTMKTSSDVKYGKKQITFRVKNYKEHRSLLSNILKRSRYAITNRANANEPYKTGGKEEFGYRFFEGAASGTVMIGVPPATKEFTKYFDWEDAVIPIPFDAPNIAETIAELDAQPERLARIRKDNVVNSLLRHDWVYRWQEILETVGVEPTEQLLERQAKLRKVADELQQLPIAN
ncbi:MAG: glycosyltransferase family 1 protein [Moorea sp. SIO2B7]|nr:glycosyltransferase family 1 protein [Moorena sp. SIO2B7]